MAPKGGTLKVHCKVTSCTKNVFGSDINPIPGGSTNRTGKRDRAQDSRKALRKCKADIYGKWYLRELGQEGYFA